MADSNIVIVLLALSCSEGRRIQSFAGPYIVVPKKLYDCESYDSEKLAWTYKARATHYKPTQPLDPIRFTGNITGRALINDSSQVSFKLDIRSNNQWKHNALVLNFVKGTGCTTLFKAAPFVADFMGYLYSPIPCAMKPGFFAFRDMPVQIQFRNVPAFPYGEYRTHFEVKDYGGAYPLFCSSGEAMVIPKP
ncbi:Endonuclease V [Frankliniella fusca]|uniref:Endonuclease V n=1 Tax=Frankliniella fusca TaxID=407009 RepID=A0AAE1H1X5_9NEOP|nr:Endonuclease V [Frankliniella fusca]